MSLQSLFSDPGTSSMDIRVRGQVRTPVASAELHDVWFHGPQHVDQTRNRSFIHLAMSRRVGEPHGHYPEVRGHSDRPIGDVMFVPSDIRFTSDWNSGGAQRSLMVQFESDDSFARDWTVAELDATLDLRDGFLQDALMRLARELEAPDFHGDLMIETLCIQIDIAIARHLAKVRGRTADKGLRLARSQVRAIEGLIDEPGPVPSVADLARECGLSVRHFCRTFRVTTGRSLTEFATERRLARARALLADGRMPIKQVAWECGFVTPAAFSAAFRRATGCQPTSYRKSVAI